MKNSDQIRNAIQSYMTDQGLSARALGQKIGVANSTVCRWINSHGQHADEIQPKHWAKLAHLLRPYLGGEGEVGPVFQKNPPEKTQPVAR